MLSFQQLDETSPGGIGGVAVAACASSIELLNVFEQRQDSDKLVSYVFSW